MSFCPTCGREHGVPAGSTVSCDHDGVYAASIEQTVEQRPVYFAVATIPHANLNRTMDRPGW